MCHDDHLIGVCPAEIHLLPCKSQAKSGTGKTIAFLTIVLERINTGRGDLQAVIMAPSRELAVQIEQVIRMLGSDMPALRTSLCIGGTSVTENAAELRRACQVVIGTPGRICSLVASQILLLDAIKVLVLDEVDRLLDLDMMEQVAKVWTMAPSQKQILAFSATYSDQLQVGLGG